MKKHVLFLFATLLSLVTSAHDFEVGGIYYNITSEEAKQAEVTYLGDNYLDYGSITIPATVTYNGVAYSVTSIGNEAFRGCSSLTAINIPENSQLTSIGSYAFYNCSSLNEITLPENSQLTSIGSHAFYNCSSLTAINIPESVTSIGDETFYGCSSLKSITLPEGVTSIGQQAFDGCSSLTAITIPESVTSIGDYAFYNCSSLTTVTIPESVTSIGDFAFYNCSSLASITIPEGVTSIGDNTFYECSSLTDITIPESVTSIGSGVFAGCSSLTAIVVAEGNPKYDSRDGCDAIIETNSNTLITGCSATIIPKSVTSIGGVAFACCYSLTAITIPEGVTSIGEGAFWACSSLTTITIPESVTSIGGVAFYGCSSLTTIVLPKSVEYVNSEAFADCSELTNVYCYAESVPNTNADAFDGSYPEYATLHVPASAMNDYKTTAPWSSFGTIKTIENVTLEKCATPTISYVDGKVVFACDTDGAIVRSNFKDNNASDYSDSEVLFIPTYTLTAYATKANYEDSDVATLTLCWIPCDENHEESDGIVTIPSKPVFISARDGVLTLSGLAEGTEVTLYTTDGVMVAHQQSCAGEATFTVDTNQVYLVHIGDKVVKIGM